MPTEVELRAMGERVRNWGRWGDDDQLGTLNLIGPDQVAAAAALVRRGVVFSLAMDIGGRGIWDGSTFRRNPIHTMTVDGGDKELLTHLDEGGGGAAVAAAMWGRGLARFNDDLLVMHLQASTQWDALAHVYYDDQLYNGVPASSVTSQGATRNSIGAMERGVVGRGVLIDVARHRGVEHLPRNERIEAGELDEVLAAQGVTLGTGDIVLVRTGWLAEFAAHEVSGVWRAGCPGLDWSCAEWLHENDVAAVVADNTAVEASAPSYPEGDEPLPLHLLCLRDMGMPFGELWDLDELAADCADDGVYEFQLVAPPLRITGAVGSPLNPVAIK